MTKQPTDRQPAKGEPFRFTVGSKSYVLPSVTKGRNALSGRDLRDAALGGEVGQLGYMIKALEASKPSAAALDALYAMSQTDMLEVLKDWGDHGDGDGASLGE